MSPRGKRCLKAKHSERHSHQGNNDASQTGRPPTDRAAQKEPAKLLSRHGGNEEDNPPSQEAEGRNDKRS
jgi:hypothetical protein